MEEILARRGVSMVKRVKRQAKAKKRAIPLSRKMESANRKASWDAYKGLQKQVDKAWSKLRADVLKNANPQTLMRDRNQLLLLLGECNYMTRECMRIIDRKNR